MISISVVVAILFDWLAGEPKRWHPLVGFGRLSSVVERLLNAKHPDVNAISILVRHNRLCGVIAVAILCLPLPLVCFLWISTLQNFSVVAYLCVEACLLYLTMGHRSLWDHISPIYTALEQQDEPSARHHTAMIVSRDSEALDIEVSAVESVLENGNDALFAALFWFVIAGGAGALFYRLINTLDAMWGYRTTRFNKFGWAAAKLDDLLNYLPARCTAFSYALLSNTKNALQCWKLQASVHASPNGGPVIAAGAGGLGILLGGPTRYNGVWHNKPLLGMGLIARANDIKRAMWLVTDTLFLWVLLIVSADLFLLILQSRALF